MKGYIQIASDETYEVPDCEALTVRDGVATLHGHPVEGKMMSEIAVVQVAPGVIVYLGDGRLKTV